MRAYLRARADPADFWCSFPASFGCRMHRLRGPSAQPARSHPPRSLFVRRHPFFSKWPTGCQNNMCGELDARVLTVLGRMVAEKSRRERTLPGLNDEAGVSTLQRTTQPSSWFGSAKRGSRAASTTVRSAGTSPPPQDLDGGCVCSRSWRDPRSAHAVPHRARGMRVACV